MAKRKSKIKQTMIYKTYI